jgi:hypothetical protein
MEAQTCPRETVKLSPESPNLKPHMNGPPNNRKYEDFAKKLAFLA